MAKPTYNPRDHGALCGECPLSYKRPVPPTGSLNADVVIVGEAPGFNEEKSGQPFVGPSGKVLDELLDSVGLDRAHVWISNTILCRPEVPDIQGQKRFDFPTYLAYIRSLNAKAKKQAKLTGQPVKLIADPISCCQMRLFAELAHFEKGAKARGRPNGVVVIPVGNFAAKTITGSESGIMKLRGSPIPLNYFDADWSKRDQSENDD